MMRNLFFRNNLSTRTIAAISAFIAVLVTLAISFFVFSMANFNEILSIVIICICSFIVSFLALYFLIHTFIYNRVRIIYKMIHHFNLSKKEKKKPDYFFNNRMMDEVESATEQFITEKQKEISQLKEMEVFRKEFLGNVAHELKTPLTAMQGHILTLLDGGLEDESINRLYLQRTSSNIERMLGIVNDLDTITQLESEVNRPFFEKFNLYHLLEEVMAILEITAKNHHVELLLDANAERSYFVFADKDKIRRVLINLIENSIKYNDKPQGKTHIAIYDVDKNYLIEIADNGIGIDRKHFPRLFERFYRVDKNRSRTTGGSGLGLAIVKHIVDAHKQTLTINSIVGEGSTFGFTLQKA